MCWLHWVNCLSYVVESGAYTTRTRQFICKACIQTVIHKDLTARTGLCFWNHLATVSFIVFNCSSNYIKTAEEARTKLEEHKVFFLFASSWCDIIPSFYIVCLPYFGQGWFVSHMSNETGQQGQVPSYKSLHAYSVTVTSNICMITEAIN